MIKLIISIVFILCSIVSCAHLPQQETKLVSNFKEGTEPDGFRGIKWGTNLDTLSGMNYSRNDNVIGGECYSRIGDDLKINGATLTSIEYCFWRGKFSHVKIKGTDRVNCEQLRNAMLEKFGTVPRDYKFGEFEHYLWLGDKVRMYYQFYDALLKCSLQIFLIEPFDEIQEYKKQKAKERGK